MSRQEFNRLLSSLADFPDAEVIGKLTLQAQQISPSSDLVADLLHRFSEVSSRMPENRLPLLYAIDSIVRSGRGRFATLLEPYVADVFKAAFQGSNDQDRFVFGSLCLTFIHTDILPI